MQKSTATAVKIVTGIVIGLAAIGAQAADWRSIGSTGSGELFIDAASVQQTGNIRQAWSMWNFKEARKNDDPTFPALKSYQDLHSYNCADHTLRLTREIIYADNNGMGDKRDHTDALKGMTFTKPADGSVAEIMLKEVCAADVAQSAKSTKAKKKK
jgi:hypothetical protein